ncbi:hypothetical protein [Tunicatimonas pelagia]|uniref:hypothetical protein n=1 Tax=Tunicatimonas pelagia TaxID=931531 RepID=UPI002666C896|nr:hypothetical protein [Tunicatimonas pelagia]WKN45178.1 hypothetical protein P0M28_09420 [Tunicatimonas pelagia]
MNWLKFYQELIRRNRMLAYVGFTHAVLFLVLLSLFFIDERTVMGINVWIKPMKFALSIVIYLWTVGWFLEYLSAYPRSVRIIAWGIAATMVIEIVCIVFQAARGVQSHFNGATMLDAKIYYTMGVAIVTNTLLFTWMTMLFFVGKIKLSPTYLLAIRLALLLFLFASAVGGMMVGQVSHSVGVADGGSGLPFVNWSTEGGDLRIAHFIGIHSLQIIPLFAYKTEQQNWQNSRVWTWLFAMIYVGVTGFIFWEATDARPLLSTLFH